MATPMPTDAPEVRTWSGERGSLEFTRRRSACRVTFVGRLTDDAAAVWTDHFTWLIGESGKLGLFLDGGRITLLSASFISAGTSAIWACRGRLAHAEALVDGTLVEMIAKTANLTLGGIMQIGRDRGEFEARLARMSASP